MAQKQSQKNRTIQQNRAGATRQPIEQRGERGFYVPLNDDNTPSGLFEVFGGAGYRDVQVACANICSGGVEAATILSNRLGEQLLAQQQMQQRLLEQQTSGTSGNRKTQNKGMTAAAGMGGSDSGTMSHEEAGRKGAQTRWNKSGAGQPQNTGTSAPPGS